MPRRVDWTCPSPLYDCGYLFIDALFGLAVARGARPPSGVTLDGIPDLEVSAPNWPARSIGTPPTGKRPLAGGLDRLGGPRRLGPRTRLQELARILVTERVPRQRAANRLKLTAAKEAVGDPWGAAAIPAGRDPSGAGPSAGPASWDQMVGGGDSVGTLRR